MEPNGRWYSTWESLGGQWPTNEPVIARNADGRLEIFMVGIDEKLYYRRQLEPNGSWTDRWESLEDIWPSVSHSWSTSPVVASNADGRLEIFIQDRGGNLYHRWQVEPNGGWISKWMLLGETWEVKPVVSTNSDGRLEIFMVGLDKQLYHRWQMKPNSTTWNSTWESLGGQWPTFPLRISTNKQS